ncbi:hypothetical protein GCM10022383_27170 [Microbacterium soli]|uniref:ABC transporter permease n=1 Tax=Microbacterium soli TaxID=446075 RepID=A0ABP7NIH9_9MICO
MDTTPWHELRQRGVIMNRLELWIADAPAWVVVPTLVASAALIACAVGIPVGLWLATAL